MFSNLDFRVYDEADKLLDTGFERNLDNINDMLKDCRTTPQPLKSLLLSATLNEQIEDFAKVHIHRKYEFLNTVESGDADVHENVHQIVVRCEDSIDKIETFVLYMANLMKTEDSFRVLVFYQPRLLLIGLLNTLMMLWEVMLLMAVSNIVLQLFMVTKPCLNVKEL